FYDNDTIFIFHIYGSKEVVRGLDFAVTLSHHAPVPPAYADKDAIFRLYALCRQVRLENEQPRVPASEGADFDDGIGERCGRIMEPYGIDCLVRVSLDGE